VLLREPEQADPEEPAEEGSAAGVTLGDQAEPGGSQRHRSAAVDGHRRPRKRPAISMCYLSLHERPTPPRNVRAHPSRL
jgi:hypothetical protein